MELQTIQLKFVRNQNLLIMKIFNSIAFTLLITFTSFSIISCDKTASEYKKNITEADGFFENSEYDDALKSYTAAANLKPEEEYPKEKISEINVIIAQAEESARIEAEIKAEENYIVEIDEGDDFYNNGEYERAIESYLQALSFKPDESYPAERINEIEQFLTADEEIIDDANNIYHIVVGSFEIESNAENFQQKLKDQGYEARLVTRLEGEYTAVILSSYPTIHDAYNNLSDARAQMGHAWIIYKRF